MLRKHLVTIMHDRVYELKFEDVIGHGGQATTTQLPTVMFGRGFVFSD